MNIEAYDVDSLRKMVRLLEYENKILKDKLKKAGIYYEAVSYTHLDVYKRQAIGSLEISK